MENVTPVKRAISQTDTEVESEAKRPKLTAPPSTPSTLSQPGNFRITPFSEEKGSWRRQMDEIQFNQYLLFAFFLTASPFNRATQLQVYVALGQNQINIKQVQIHSRFSSQSGQT